MVHGLGGSAPLLLLTLAGVSSPFAAFSYITVFGAGSMIGMAIMSFLLSMPARLTVDHFAPTNVALPGLSGLISVGLGFFIVYENAVLNRPHNGKGPRRRVKNSFTVASWLSQERANHPHRRSFAITSTRRSASRSRCRTKPPAKGLMRMLGPSGNPQARNLFEVIRHLQKERSRSCAQLSTRGSVSTTAKGPTTASAGCRRHVSAEAFIERPVSLRSVYLTGKLT